MRRRVLNGPLAGVIGSLAVLVLAVGAFSLTSLAPYNTVVAQEEGGEAPLIEEDPVAAAPAGTTEPSGDEAAEEEPVLGQKLQRMSADAKPQQLDLVGQTLCDFGSKTARSAFWILDFGFHGCVTVILPSFQNF